MSKQRSPSKSTKFLNTSDKICLFFFIHQVGRSYMFSPIIFKSQRALDAAKSSNRKTGYRAGEQNVYCPIKVIKLTSWPESLDMMEQ